jgi:Fic family protein
MIQSMSDLEKYINGDDELDILIRAGLIHYQFETIHPFLDGNGRIGRLLITLFLMEKKVLSTPALYISYFLKKNKIEYYDRMNEVRLKGNYEQWIKFFLEAVYESSKDSVKTIDNLTSLHDKYYLKIESLGRRAKNAIRVFEYLESNPIIEIQKTAKELHIAFNTMSSIVKDLINIGVLEQTSTQSRNRTFVYKEYMEILKEGT